MGGVTVEDIDGAEGKAVDSGEEGGDEGGESESSTSTTEDMESGEGDKD